MLVVPSPKLHRYDVMEPVDLLVNATFKGAFPEVTFAVKLGAGAGTALPVTLIIVPMLLLPPGPVTFSTTLYVPAAE